MTSVVSTAGDSSPLAAASSRPGFPVSCSRPRAGSRTDPFDAGRIQQLPPGRADRGRIGGGGFWMTGTVRRAGDGAPLAGQRIQIWAHTTEGQERRPA